ncbi:hypothetical protein NQ314_004517 [Rhamnusium bicolor]|uniref:DDE Tnp4 domain-containing protein n=1 Tax=Rhamnusium bicolor TaxID=1586634 RepID=A0AAV8ZLG2_9CUCU|nr:hypothetical protein NQ314_004517 [Rhamnusium bicolor]
MIILEYRMYLSIVSCSPGLSHDSTIYNISRVRARFENGEIGNNVLVGDRGYANRSYLITPLANPSIVVEHLFNESQIKTRNPIERFL